LKLAFANPSGQSNPVTIHARKSSAKFEPTPYTDMFFDDMKTLYDLSDPQRGQIRVEQTYSDYRKGSTATLDSLSYIRMPDAKIVDLDTAKPLRIAKTQMTATTTLEVPITDDRQSAHLQITGTLEDGTYKLAGDELQFDRVVRGLRNTILLPAGWEVSNVSQSGTIGTYQGRQFVALINLNGENQYTVHLRARRH
jgi:hypothetical protein